MEKHHVEAAQRIQERFYFYLVGLAFTILGLSIQTSRFGQSVFSDSFELAGWIFLLVSGIVGIMKLEWEPHIHKNIADLNTLEADKNKYIEIAASIVGGGEGMQPLQVQEAIKRISSDIAVFKKTVEVQSKMSIRKYRIHKYSFMAGVISLVVARGFVPFKNLIRTICQ